METVVVEMIPLRPDEKKVRLEYFNVLKCSDCLDKGSIGSVITSLADGWERRSLGQPRPKVNGNIWYQLVL